MDGYRKALDDAGILYDPDIVVSTSDLDHPFLVCALVQHLLRDHPDITAVVAGTDIAAMGAIRAAHLAGRQVPANLAVIGFDNISLGAALVPALTSVAQPIGTIATSALDLMLQHINEGGVALDHRRVLLETQLIIRESCGGRRPA